MEDAEARNQSRDGAGVIRRRSNRLWRVRFALRWVASGRALNSIVRWGLDPSYRHPRRIRK